MRVATRGSLAVGAVAGVVSGLAGSWLMLRFIEEVGPRLLEGLKTDGERAQDQGEMMRRQKKDGGEPDSVTMQAADTFANMATSGRHLTHEERQKGGTLVHYAFGAAMGAVYGMVAEVWPLPTVGVGSVFGTVLWMGTDLWAVPAVGFAKWPTEEPAAAHVTHWLAHMVFEVGMEGTRRVLRAL